MADLWVWADPHLDHPAIIGFCGRPFANLKEMNDCLMSNYNDVVKPQDDVVLLGDIAFRNHSSFIGNLKGRKTFIFGNHDRMPLDVLRNFTRVIGARHMPGILEMALGKYQLVFSHYPLASWNGSFHGTWNVHGHCHGRMPEQETMLRMDAGVDVFDYKPVNIDVIVDKLTSRLPAWRKRMQERGCGENDAELDKTRVTNKVFVDRWRTRIQTQPDLYRQDYHIRYQDRKGQEPEHKQ